VKTSRKLALTLVGVPILVPLIFLAYGVLVSGYLSQGVGHVEKGFRAFLVIALVSYAMTSLIVMPLFLVLRSRRAASLGALPLWAALLTGLVMFAGSLLRPSDVPGMLIVVAVMLVAFNATVCCAVFRWRTPGIAA